MTPPPVWKESVPTVSVGSKGGVSPAKAPNQLIRANTTSKPMANFFQ